jgi:hypothetical protein
MNNNAVPNKTPKGWKIETDKGAIYLYLEKIEPYLVPTFGDSAVTLAGGSYFLAKVKREWKNKVPTLKLPRE